MSDIEDRARYMLQLHYKYWMRYGDRDDLRSARLLSYVVTGRLSYQRYAA